MLPTPAFTASRIANDFFFAASDDPDCELPCWQGLRVGESGREEIQALFDDVFGFDGTLDFFTDNPLEIARRGIRVPWGLYLTGYSWYFQPDGLFDLFVWTDRDTYVLEGIEFYWSATSDPSRFHMSPQRVLRELGTPSEALVWVTGTERVGTGVLFLVIIYEEGMVFRYEASVSLEETDTGFSVEFCLGDDRPYGFAFITEPLTGNLDDLTLAQSTMIGWVLRNCPDMATLQDVFDVSLDEATELASQGGRACLHSTVSDSWIYQFGCLP